tara:strand:+ start:8303 stop:10912 length:2610 start_codon:yes stop_codon:yes gene_type:complete
MPKEILIIKDINDVLNIHKDSGRKMSGAGEGHNLDIFKNLGNDIARMLFICILFFVMYMDEIKINVESRVAKLNINQASAQKTQRFKLITPEKKSVYFSWKGKDRTRDIAFNEYKMATINQITTAKKGKKITDAQERKFKKQFIDVLKNMRWQGLLNLNNIQAHDVRNDIKELDIRLYDRKIGGLARDLHQRFAEIWDMASGARDFYLMFNTLYRILLPNNFAFLKWLNKLFFQYYNIKTWDKKVSNYSSVEEKDKTYTELFKKARVYKAGQGEEENIIHPAESIKKEFTLLISRTEEKNRPLAEKVYRYWREVQDLNKKELDDLIKSELELKSIKDVVAGLVDGVEMNDAIEKQEQEQAEKDSKALDELLETEKKQIAELKPKKQRKLKATTKPLKPRGRLAWGKSPIIPKATNKQLKAPPPPAPPIDNELLEAEKKELYTLKPKKQRKPKVTNKQLTPPPPPLLKPDEEQVNNWINVMENKGLTEPIEYSCKAELEEAFYIAILQKYNVCSVGRLFNGESSLKTNGKSFLNYKGEQQKKGNNIIAKKYLECKAKNKPLVISLTTIYKGDNHSNVLLFNPILNQVEHFEPHGAEFRPEENMGTYNNDLKKLLEGFVKKINVRIKVNNKNATLLTFKSPADVCPSTAEFQGIEYYTQKTAISNFTGLKITNDSGLCCLFTTFLLQLRLQNLKMNPKRLLEVASKRTKENPASFKSLIRGISKDFVENVRPVFNDFTEAEQKLYFTFMILLVSKDSEYKLKLKNMYKNKQQMLVVNKITTAIYTANAKAFAELGIDENTFPTKSTKNKQAKKRAIDLGFILTSPIFTTINEHDVISYKKVGNKLILTIISKKPIGDYPINTTLIYTYNIP